MGGSCLCVSSRKQFPTKHTDFSQYPDDLNQFTAEKIATLPKLEFSALLYNIVLVNYPKVEAQLILGCSFIKVLNSRYCRSAVTQEIKATEFE